MPYTVRPVAIACLSAGFDVAAPLLPGHGYAQLADQRREFAAMTMEKLLVAARTEVQQARQHYDWVGVYGDSMGGALALAIASEGIVNACAVTAPALKLPPRAKLLDLIPPWVNLNIPKAQSKEFYNPCYSFENSKAGRELKRLSRYARNLLSNIHCPVFVAHSRRDRTIPPVVVDWLQHQVAGQVEHQWFDESGHVLPLDVNGAEVCGAIAQFLNRSQTHQPRSSHPFTPETFRNLPYHTHPNPST
jgi:carboxylesterase